MINSLVKMNMIRMILLLTFVCFGMVTVKAQNWRYGNQINDYYYHDWSFTAGVNVIEDANQTIGGITNPGLYWNFSKPFYIGTEYYLNNKFSFNLLISVNQYSESKQIDLLLILEGHEASYFAVDLGTKFYFRDLLNSYKFDPFVFVGFGYTNIGSYVGKSIDKTDEKIVAIDSMGRPTIDGGIGFNFWFSQKWGLSMSMIAKYGIATRGHIKASNEISNHLQYTIGGVYFLN